MSDIIYKMGNTHYAFDKHNAQKNKEGDINMKDDSLEKALKKAQSERNDFISDINITYNAIPSSIETSFTSGDEDMIQAMNMSTNTISLVRKLDLSQQSYFNISQYSYYKLAIDMIRGYLLSAVDISRARDYKLTIADVASSLKLTEEIESIEKIHGFIDSNSTEHNNTLLLSKEGFEIIENDRIIFDKSNKLILLPYTHRLNCLLKKENITDDGKKIAALLFDPKSIYVNIKDIKIEYIDGEGKPIQQMILNIDVIYTKNIYAAFVQ